MGLRFIFMLTRDDRTVEDAEAHLDIALEQGLRHIGFKDVGLPVERLKALAQRIRAAGATSYLEVVSLDRNSELASARAALEIGVDVLLGGTRVPDVLNILDGADIAYFPFPGRIEGHPSRLCGSVDEIVESARSLAAVPGVSGLDLLAWRWTEGDPTALIEAVCIATDKPVIVAGSIGSAERIAAARAAGAAGVTIGTAALDGEYTASASDLEAQLRAILRDVAFLNGHLSQHGKKNLAEAFERFEDTWSPRIAGRINEMHLKLAKFEGSFVWHHHAEEDELFLVHRGRLLMRFRDREEIVEQGEFIIVPSGVEHCPVALSSVCEVVLLEPATTVNTGNVMGDRTVTDLIHV